MAIKQLQRDDDFDLSNDKYGVAVSWDCLPGKAKIDIDLQCVVVDESGSIVDCVYYNNLKAGRAITHSGDESTGEAAGLDEVVWVTIPTLPEKVCLLIFVIAAHSGGKLGDVANGLLHILERSKSNEIARFQMERSEGAVDVVAAMFRKDTGKWALRIVEEPAQEGQHFMDVLPLLSDVIRRFVCNAPKRQKVAFAMEKGSVIDFPKSLTSITVGLGWDAASGGSEVDLDVSAVLLDSSGVELETVFFGNLESKKHGIQHSGDNLTGEGSGDDEQIVVQLESIGAEVQQIAFVINIYTRGVTFQQVSSPYCRVVDNSPGGNGELCKYALQDAGNQTGLLVSKIAREAGGRWGFHALGLPCNGRTYKDSLPEIGKACCEKAAQYVAPPPTSTQMHANAGSDGSLPIPLSVIILCIVVVLAVILGNTW